MAGSYQHCEEESGKFQFDLIENMGDAHEACEHMFHMIQYLTKCDEWLIEAASQAAYDKIYPWRIKDRFDKKQALKEV